MAAKRKAERPLLGRNGFKYHQQFGVIVICKNERDQARVYGVLTRRGLRCKVVTV
jgi:hypothetical protein